MILSLGATIVETVAVTVEKSVEHPLGAFIREQWRVERKLARKFAVGARIVGMLAGVYAGIYDIVVSAPAARSSGNELLSTLYTASGILSIGIAMGAYFSIGAIFWPFLILSFGIAIAIAYVNNSALKNWIARCEFSTGGKYISFDTQLKAFYEAIGA